MRSLAIIPARGGSKRLPRKNVLSFLGKPMLVWAAEAAKDSAVFDRILISTEDEQIASTGQRYGFEVSLRDASLATDQATCAQVCLDLLETLEREGETYDALCCLYATAPLRTAGDIVNTMRLLGTADENEADFAVAVTGYSHSPYQMLIPDSQEFLDVAMPFVAYKKSQALPVPVIGNGSTYAARVSAFKIYKRFSGPRMRGYVMPKIRSIDIDTAEDFEMALFAAQYLQSGAHK